MTDAREAAKEAYLRAIREGRPPTVIYDTVPNPNTLEARLARAEQAIDLLLRMFHGHGLMHMDHPATWPQADELIAEWNTIMADRFGDQPGFEPLVNEPGT